AAAGLARVARNGIGEADGVAHGDGRSGKKRCEEKTAVETGEVGRNSPGFEANEVVAHGILKRDLESAAQSVQNRAIDFGRTEGGGERRQPSLLAFGNAGRVVRRGMGERSPRSCVRGVRLTSKRQREPQLV